MPINLPFINRKRDIRFLSSLLDKEPRNQRVIIVSAETGIGKTSLVDKLLDERKHVPVAHVRVIDYPRFSADQGEYMQRVFDAVVELGTNDRRLPSYTSFQRDRRGRTTLRTVVKGTLVHLGGKYLGEEAAKAVKEIADDATKGVIEEPQADAESYALDIFERYECILRIENVQKIDPRSLEMLCRILSICPKVRCIMEYTNGVADALPLSTIRDFLKASDLSVNDCPIEAIAVEELFDELKEFPALLFETVKRHYEAERGNLRVLIDLKVTAEYAPDSEVLKARRLSDADATPALSVIRIMERPMLFVLTAVVTHGGEAELDLLVAAVSGLSSQEVKALGLADLKAIVDSLCAINYLTRSKDILRVAHDSIIPAVAEGAGGKKMSLVATRMWVGLYRNMFDGRDGLVPRTEILRRLALLYSSLEQLPQLLWVLEQCGRSALESLAPRRLLSLFDQIIDGTKSKSLAINPAQVDQVLEFQAEILYDANWLDEACECFERVSNLSLRGRLMYADACIGTSRADLGFDALVALEAEREQDLHEDKGLHLSIGLIRLHGLRAAGELAKCEALFRRLQEMLHLLSPREQAFLMRSADVGLYRDTDVAEIIACLHDSIALCAKHDLQADEAAARLALSQHLGYLGRLDEASKQLDAVEALSGTVWIERYSLLNNRAILMLLAGGDRDEAIALLNKALMLATEDGDRLLILANILGAGQASAGEQVQRLLEDIPDLSDELAKIATYNLSVFYADAGGPELAQQYFEKSAALSDEPDALFWRSVFNGDAPAHEGTRLRLEQRSYLTFIVHWRLTSSTFKGIG